jgi:hypothetical protein
MATLTQNVNHLAPTSFKLVIDRRNYPNLEFFAQMIQHPGAAMTAAEFPVPRLSSVSQTGDKLTFSELTCMIILDEDMNAYTEMYDWMQRIVNTNRNPATARDGIPTEADITISILSSHNNGNKQIRYIDCVPTAVGDINFEATADDAPYIVFPTTFRFSYFEIT